MALDLERIPNSLAISRERAIDALAARLYWKMEKLDPALPDVPIWDGLTERQREFYRLCVSDLLEFDGLMRVIYGAGQALETT
jgi:hypothetical protein